MWPGSLNPVLKSHNNVSEKILYIERKYNAKAKSYEQTEVYNGQFLLRRDGCHGGGWWDR